MIRALANGCTIQTFLKADESQVMKPKIIIQYGDTKIFLSQYEYTKLAEFISQFNESLAAEEPIEPKKSKEK